MDERQRAIERFLQAVKNSPRLWQALDLRVTAARAGGSWHNLMARGYLDARDPEDVVCFQNLPKTRVFSCWQLVVPVQSLEDVLNAVAEGELELEGERVILQQDQFRGDAAARPYSSAHYIFSDLSEGYHRTYLYWSAHSLTLYGSSIHEIFRNVPGGEFEIDNGLRTLEHPYDGWRGVARLILGSPETLEQRDTTGLELYAPVEALLNTDACQLERNRLAVAITAGSKQVIEHCELGIVGVGDLPLPVSRSVRLRPDNWRRQGDSYAFEHVEELPDCRSVTVLLRVGKCCVHRANLIDYAAMGENPCVAAYGVFDPELEWFRASLTPAAESRAKEFEQAVARLFTFAGFQVDSLALASKLRNPIDVIVYTKTPPLVFAVECTTGSLGSDGKLGKLAARAKRIQTALRAHRVVGVLTTALPRAEISSAEIGQAAADRLVVLAREDLETLATLAISGASANQATAFILSRVPSQSAVEGFLE